MILKRFKNYFVSLHRIIVALMPKITNIGHKKHTPTRVVVPNSIGIGAGRNFGSGFSYNLFFPMLIISSRIKQRSGYDKLSATSSCVSALDVEERQSTGLGYKSSSRGLRGSRVCSGLIRNNS